MAATKLDFFHHIGDPIRNRNITPRYVAAIKVLVPDFDHDSEKDNSFLDAFETLITNSRTYSQYEYSVKITEEAVRRAAEKRGSFSLPAIISSDFHHEQRAFKRYVLSVIELQSNEVPRVCREALRLLQTIFELLQYGVLSALTLDGRRKLRLESRNGAACEIFMDPDAIGITDSADEDDDTEVFQLDDQDVDDSSDEADEAVLLELVAQEEKEYDESSVDDDFMDCKES